MSSNIPSVVWLAPVPTIDLLTRQRCAAARAGRPSMPPTSRWTVDAVQVMVARTHLAADAAEVLASAWTGPITGWLDSLDLVQFDPVRTLSRRSLRI